MELCFNQALKEWSVAVSALTQGDTILLLRKGGIREHQRTFQVEQDRVWLYPTYEHQKPHLLKAPYAEQVEPVSSGWHPETVAIAAWAEITHIFQVTEEPTVTALLPFHIWNEQFVTERLKWKPSQPLYVLLLRVHQLANPRHISYRAEYGGCRSWIDLHEPISIQDTTPVLSETTYHQQVEAIQQILESPLLNTPA